MSWQRRVSRKAGMRFPLVWLTLRGDEMRQGPRRVIYALIVLILTMGFAVGRAIALPMPNPISVPEPAASLCLGMALFGLAGYVWWSHKKRQGRN
jgi:hypothetical protein